MGKGNGYNRRKFIRHCFMGGCGLALSAYTLNDFVGQGYGALDLDMDKDMDIQVGCLLERSAEDSQVGDILQL